jgi:hypothetical protein
MSKASDKKAKATKGKPNAVSVYKQAQSKPTTTPMPFAKGIGTKLK